MWFHRFLGCLGYLGTARLRRHHRSTSARTVTSTTLRSFYLAIALSPYEPSLRSFPIETSHLSIAGPRHLCTLVIVIDIAYHIIVSNITSSWYLAYPRVPQECSAYTIATLIREAYICAQRKSSEALKQKSQSKQRNNSIIRLASKEIIHSNIILCSSIDTSYTHNILVIDSRYFLPLIGRAQVRISLLSNWLASL